MILVMGFWIFLRAVFFGSAAIALENVALRHQLLVLQRRWVDHGWLGGTGSSGSGCHACGRAGGPVSSSCNRPRCWPGTAEASGSAGAGSPGPTRAAARDS